jgi:leucyl aminopeptidase
MQNESTRKSSVAITVESLPASSYSDLIKRRKPGQKYRPAAGTDRAIQVGHKDLIVLTKFHNEEFGKVALAVDKQLDGALQEAVNASDFSGRQGETLLVQLEARGLGSGNARKVLLVGLGNRPNYGQLVFCGFVGCVLSESSTLEAEQILLPLADIAGTDTAAPARLASVLKCRVNQHLATSVEHGRLKKIRLAVLPEWHGNVEEALVEREQLCRTCSDPSI